MSPNLMHALVAEHQHELERQAGCCTPAAEHRREMTHPPSSPGSVHGLLRLASISPTKVRLTTAQTAPA